MLRRDVELLNNLDKLLPLGTVTDLAPSLPSPEPGSPDGWNWLPPGNFPAKWHYLEELEVAQLIRLTYRIQGRRICVRVYAVPEDVRAHGATLTKSSRTLVHRLLSALDTSENAWYLEPGEAKPFWQPGRSQSLATIYSTLPSPTDSKILHLNHTGLHARSFAAIASNSIPGLISQLYPYQQRSVSSMLARELFPAQILDPIYSIVKGPLSEFYLELDNLRIWKCPSTYAAPKGGILGEEMGTGKTCESLALILASLDQVPSNPINNPFSNCVPVCKPKCGSLLEMCAQTIQEAGVLWRSRYTDLGPCCIQALNKHRRAYTVPAAPLRKLFRRSTYDTEAVTLLRNRTYYLSHATLLVVPDTLVAQWRHEISKHIQDEFLRVLIIQSTGAKYELTKCDDLPSVDDLLNYDVVIISHSRFSREHQNFRNVQKCNCPYVKSTRTVDCQCPRPEQYESPLLNIHWKRLMVDEGHTMASQSTKAVRFAGRLRVERRWVVSGTPTKGLVGASAEGQEGECCERSDLDKLGITVCDFLGLQGLDVKKWKNLIAKPFLEGAHGAEDVVRTLLRSIIVRNRKQDIARDVVLPPLSKRVVFLEATAESVRSLNIFNSLIAINSVTSQRVDQDYFFHKSQSNALQNLIRNLLRSTFWWTGTALIDVRNALEVAEEAHDKMAKTYSESDRELLLRSIQVLREACSSESWLKLSELHEMGYHIERFPKEASNYYSLYNESKIFGGSCLASAQQAVDKALQDPAYNEDAAYPLDDKLTSAGIRMRARETKQKQLLEQSSNRRSKQSLDESPKASIDYDNRTSSASGLSKSPKIYATARHSGSPMKQTMTIPKSIKGKSLEDIQAAEDSGRLAGDELVFPSTPTKLSSIQQLSLSMRPLRQEILERSSMKHTKIMSSCSSKLNYLVSQILKHSRDEKLIVFSEMVDHTYHLAECLDIIGVQYLVYTSSLSASRRSQYILTFNTSETFRVLVMDLQLAAHGLNLSTASRIYFIGQVWSGAVEAQAIKRAHRIGQTKPVHVEILVLKGTVEEAMQKRRLVMSGREIGNTKTALDDNVFLNTVKFPRFLPEPAASQPMFDPIALFGIRQMSNNGEENLASFDRTHSAPKRGVDSDPDLSGRAISKKTKVCDNDGHTCDANGDVGAKKMASKRRTPRKEVQRGIEHKPSSLPSMPTSPRAALASNRKKVAFE